MNYEPFSKLEFVKHRNKFFLLSAIVTVVGMLVLAIFGLHTGVDFSAGSSLDITIGNESTHVEEARQLIEQAVPEAEPVITVGGDGNNRVSARFTRVLEDAERDAILNAFRDRFGLDSIDYEENMVDPVIAREMAINAILGVAAACVGIIIYVSIRFEWRIALSAIIALLHAPLIVLSIFSIFRLEVNLPFVAAILTIIGYAINDTIIIFDRIRENIKTSKLKTFDDLAQLVNRSIRQTLTRSLNTSITTIFACIALLALGSEAIRLFSLAMLVGLFAGVYASNLIAGQVWILLKYRSLTKEKAGQSAA